MQLQDYTGEHNLVNEFDAILAKIAHDIVAMGPADARPARHWFERLAFDIEYRRAAVRRPDSGPRIWVEAVLRDPLRRLLVDPEISGDLPSRERVRWVAILLAQRGWNPEQVAEVLWSLAGARRRGASRGREYVAQVLREAYRLLACTEAAIAAGEGP